MNKGLITARKLGKIFSFIVDATVINDGEDFEKAFHEIHPPEREWRKENTSPFETLSLDLNIKILDKTFKLDL